MEEMTKDDIQRFLNIQAREGKTKEQAFDLLVELVGATMPEFQEAEKDD